MGFLTNLLGSDNAYLTAVIGLGIVLILIVAGVWLLKVVSDASRVAGRGRSRRLGVIDSVPLDQKRQAILLRRDNVEHLIITGGPQDVVVETGIAHQPAQPARAATRPAEGRTEPRLDNRGRTQETGTGRSRAIAAARQRNAALPLPASDAPASGNIGQNGLRNGPDSAIADPHAEGEQGAADYETADMGEREHDHYQGSDDRRRE